MSMSGAPSAVRAIFALDVVTASLAFICLVIGILLTIRAFGLRSRSRNYDRVSRDTPRHSPLGTFAFLLPGLALLCLAYSIAAATTALQYDASSPINITPAYAYYYSSASESSQASRVTSRLSFVNAFALILYSTLLTAAVWLHSSHVTSNGLGIGAPSLRDWIWNMFILAAILGTGLASWGQAISVRESAQGYSSVMQADSTSRALYAAFRCTVIAASTSVSVEVAGRYREVNANGPPSNSGRPILARLVFYAVPIWAVRNVFLIVDIAMAYTSAESWSIATRQAIAFLLIIFGQIADLAIFVIVTWGAWTMGRVARW
ncbi:hypothetical protein CB0940_11433 [Cercospora beticola]|uniref:Protein RTA1 n=1 Tax=Cercospora beticola TaxID=122368 RepID=A0A2G5HDK7_CERBT|nr:hypothetical protein CB0940_11433 [Cercospora beticola]PIA90627.1 hypothetical protein CB0940_11433 [Cercospora beticola]WPB08287.1 hypothetical protein RHO25_012953 [Cercospora beticola]